MPPRPLPPVAVRIPTLERIAVAGSRIAGLGPTEAAVDDPFWREVQQSFSVSRSIINLNNAGLCASPKIVTDAVTNLMMQQERLPSRTAFTTFPRELENVRIGLAHTFGCDPEEIAIVRNATEALQTVLLGVPLRSGDEILTTTHDYWAMRDALRQRKQRDGISVRLVQIPVTPASMDELIEAVEDGITHLRPR